MIIKQPEEVLLYLNTPRCFYVEFGNDFFSFLVHAMTQHGMKILEPPRPNIKETVYATDKL